MKTRTGIALVGLASFTLIGCGKSATPEPQMAEAEPASDMAPASATENTGTSQEAMTAAEPAPSQPATTPTAPPPAPLTDAEIARIDDLVNSAEVEQAKTAQKKVKNQRVKKFVAMMISEHTRAKQKGSALIKKAKITPSESTLSSELDGNASQALQSLQDAAATDVDRIYMAAQVDQHQRVLDLLDTRMIPAAQNADMKAHLEKARQMVDSHLQQAKEIQQELASGATSGPGASSKSSTPPASGTHDMHKH